MHWENNDVWDQALNFSPLQVHFEFQSESMCQSKCSKVQTSQRFVKKKILLSEKIEFEWENRIGYSNTC